MAVKALLNLFYDDVTQSPSEDKIGLEDCSVQASMIADISNNISCTTLRTSVKKVCKRWTHRLLY